MFFNSCNLHSNIVNDYGNDFSLLNIIELFISFIRI